MKIVKKMKKKDQEYALVKGIKPNQKLDLISKRYSKKYHLTAFPSMHLTTGKLLLIKRKKPLKKPLKYNDW